MEDYKYPRSPVILERCQHKAAYFKQFSSFLADIMISILLSFLEALWSYVYNLFTQGVTTGMGSKRKDCHC